MAIYRLGSIFRLFLICVFLLVSSAAGKLDRRASSGYNFVDPLIGTANGGLF